MSTNTKCSIQARLQSRIHKRAAYITRLQDILKRKEFGAWGEFYWWHRLKEVEESQKLDKAIMREVYWG